VARRLAGDEGSFDLATMREPYRVEGKKTMGLELAEDLGWRLPDVIVYPTGGGTGLVGMWKAFAELEALRLVGAARPRMVAVQAEGCAPIVRAFERGALTAEPWEGAATRAAPAFACPWRSATASCSPRCARRAAPRWRSARTR
jgi:threonine synthase